MKNRRFTALIALSALATSLLLQGCAGTPKQPTAPPKLVAAGSEDSGEDFERALAEAARGYNRVTRNGVLLFCRSERPSGSNIATNTCITETQLRERVENAKKFQEDVKQQGRRCSNGPACQPG